MDQNYIQRVFLQKLKKSTDEICTNIVKFCCVLLTFFDLEYMLRWHFFGTSLMTVQGFFQDLFLHFDCYAFQP